MIDEGHTRMDSRVPEGKGVHWAGEGRRRAGSVRSAFRARWRGGIARIPLTVATVAALLLQTGCLYLPSKGASGRVLVVGLGLVSIHDPADSAVVATSCQVLGLQASNRPGLKVGFGYSSGVVTTVADGAEDVRAEVSLRPFGPLNVKIQKAVLVTPSDSIQTGDCP